MAFSVALPNFSKGEIAPALYGRIDTNQYGAALKKARNFIVQKYGGVTFRPGTRLVQKVDNSDQATRLIPFQVSIDQAYALVFQQGKMRPAALGGFVLEANTKITGATKAVQCALTVPFHGYAVGDRVHLMGIVGMVELNGRFAQVVSVPDGNTITIDVDSRTFGTFVSSDGALNAAPPPAPPPAPVIPAPQPEPDPPVVGGGGGNYCVAAHTWVKTPGGEVQARDLKAGDMVRTQHEETMRWGNFRVDAIEFVEEDVLVATIDDIGRGVRGVRLTATPDHRVHTGKRWNTMRELGGVSAGRTMVAKITVDEAHTYISNGLLSHNIKQQEAL